MRYQSGGAITGAIKLKIDNTTPASYHRGS
jgi:hypothetical protein